MPGTDLAKILDQDSVKYFRRLLYEVTGLDTSFYFPGWGGERPYIPYPEAPREARPQRLGFCELVQVSPAGLERCYECDAGMCETVRRMRKPLITECHAGLIGVAVPVYSGEEFLGALLAGDFLTRKPSKSHFESIQRRLRGLDIDFEGLEKEYRTIPVIPRLNVETIVGLLFLIVNYIADREQIIRLQETIYRKQEKITRTVTEQGELEKDIREKMDEVRKLRKQLVAAVSIDKSAFLSGSDPGRSSAVERARTFIDRCYTGDLTLERVAGHVGLSPNYLSALFHKEVGCTFVDYIAQRRISKACELLQNTRLNVSEVALKVGFANISYFNRLFKKIMGIPPGKFRNRVNPV